MRLNAFVRQFVLACATAFILQFGSMGKSCAENHFFPAVPASAKFYEKHGVITSYASGNGSGGMVLLDHSGHSHDFYLARVVNFQGSQIVCVGAVGYHFESCHFPKEITLGKTPVKVRYFLAQLDGDSVKVAADIELDDK